MVHMRVRADFRVLEISRFVCGGVDVVVAPGILSDKVLTQGEQEQFGFKSRIESTYQAVQLVEDVNQG